MSKKKQVIAALLAISGFLQPMIANASYDTDCKDLADVVPNYCQHVNDYIGYLDTMMPPKPKTLPAADYDLGGGASTPSAAEAISDAIQNQSGQASPPPPPSNPGGVMTPDG